MTKFQAGALFTSQVMGCQVQAIRKSIRPLSVMKVNVLLLFKAHVVLSYSPCGSAQWYAGYHSIVIKPNWFKGIHFRMSAS